MNIFKRLFRKKDLNKSPSVDSAPTLVQSTDLVDGDVGKPIWNIDHNNDLLTFLQRDSVVEWEEGNPRYGSHSSPSWVPISTQMRLHSGAFSLEFNVIEMAEAQLGIGFMLDWSIGADWGFFGYLGSSGSAWSYDPSSGDIVNNTNSIAGSLPKFENGRSGSITIEFELTQGQPCWARFVVDGEVTQKIDLPVNAVILPAACLLKETQRVEISTLKKMPNGFINNV